MIVLIGAGRLKRDLRGEVSVAHGTHAFGQAYVDPRVEALATRVLKVGFGLEYYLVQLAVLELSLLLSGLLVLALGPELHAPPVGVGDPVHERHQESLEVRCRLSTP